MKKCEKCNSEISQERIAFFQKHKKECLTCVACSDVKKVTGVMIYLQKTGGELQVTKDEETNLIFYKSRKRSTYNAAVNLGTYGKTSPGKFSITTSADTALKK